MLNSEKTKTIFRVLLGLFLLTAGLAHLSWLRSEFLAQVPQWIPLDPDFVVLASGVVEIALGLSLIALKKRAPEAGLITALFFVAIFPGNISQYINQIDAFGLNTDQARFTRLFFQPVLIAWALWSTNVLSKFSLRKKN